MATTVVLPQIETHHAHAGLSIAVTVISVLIVVLSVTDIIAAFNLQCVMGDKVDAVKASEETHVRGSEDRTAGNKTKTARTINKVNLMISSFALIGALFCAFVSVTTKEMETKIILLLVVSILAIVQGSLTFAGQTEYEDCVHSNFDKITAGISIGLGSLSFLGMIVSMAKMNKR
tara:strand:- start:32 stop:556 length:525 start_codon:yes stop_codon:yes gene_type:complete